MDRRDFLDPRRLAETAGQVLGAVAGPEASPSAQHLADELTLLRYARAAMGTVFEVVLPFGHALPSEALNEVLDLIDVLEDQLSVYRETSEVSRLNERAFHEAVVVEPALFSLLKQCVELSNETEGAFDVTAGALVEAWGFFKGPKRVPSDDERQASLARTGSRFLLLDSSHTSVRYAVDGLTINLGSIGKGYALDRAAQWLHDAWGDPAVLLHGGQSSVLGVQAPPGESQGWPVRLEHPWDPARPLATVYLRDAAMATSAATYKHLVHAGKKLGHILDPRSGWPAQGIASATALAASAAAADALATAFYILGTEKTAEYCAQHPLVGAILLREGNPEPILFNVNGPGQPVVDHANE